MLRLLLAWAHLIALGIGLGAVWARGSALRTTPPDDDSLSRAFVADTWWGVAAGLWILTGLARLFGGTEKATSYYMHNHLFLAKMLLLVVILALETWPMITLIRWRRLRGRGALDAASRGGAAQRVAAISMVEAVVVAVMVGLAVAMARGYGARA
jgi:putative membrane protein